MRSPLFSHQNDIDKSHEREKDMANSHFKPKRTYEIIIGGGYYDQLTNG